jgi:hypothetical protein
MAYRAFLLGRNGGNLEHCYRSGAPSDPEGLDDCDVRRMRDALQRVGYETVVAPETLSRGQLGDLLGDALKSNADDHILFYYSGHGYPDEHDFNLVLREADQEHPEPEYWPADWVIATLNHCKAHSRLLILDCCYAGAAARQSWSRMQGNIAILASASEVALSPMRPGVGSAFTQCLCDALTKPEHWVTGEAGVIDEQGVIWVQRLCTWLKRRMQVLEPRPSQTQASDGKRHFAEPVCYVGLGAQEIKIAEVSPRHTGGDRQMTQPLSERVALGRPVFRDQARDDQPRDFFGRQQEKDQVLRLLTGVDTRVVIVQGERRMGKTSMLMLTEEELRRQDPGGERMIVTPYIMVDTVKSASEFFWELTKGLPRTGGTVGGDVNAPSCHVFLSYRHSDRPIVEQLARALDARGLIAWWDRDHLVPGESWQQAVDEVIRSAGSAAILIGKDGIGGWQETEMRACMSQRGKRRMRVIPVLLPGTPDKVELPPLLSDAHRVDMRNGLGEGDLDLLHCGVIGCNLRDFDRNAAPPPLKAKRPAPATGLAAWDPDSTFNLELAHNWMQEYIKTVPGKRIFVFMDELDECLVSHAPPEERRRILRLIGLLAKEFPVRFLFSMIRIPARLEDRETETFVTDRGRAIYLDPFGPEDHEAMVRALLQEYLSVTDEAIRHLHQQSGGWPFFSKVVMWELEGLLNSADPWGRAFQKAVRYDPKSRLSEAMDHVYRLHLDSHEQAVLRLLASASVPVPVAELTEQSSTFPMAAERLKSRNYLLGDDDNAFRHRVELLRDWFRNREHSSAKPEEGKESTRKPFRVALSFTEDDRGLARAVAEKLVQDSGSLQNFQILFDDWRKDELTGPDRGSRLTGLYRDESELMVVLLRKEPGRKRWCGLRWYEIKRVILDRHRRGAGVMLCRSSPDLMLDGGWSGDYEETGGLSAEKLARRIIERYQALPGPQAS